jgi:hypothetical protein
MTGPYRPGTPAPGQHAIEYLWSRVDELPDDQWPAGVVWNLSNRLEHQAA